VLAYIVIMESNTTNKGIDTMSLHAEIARLNVRDTKEELANLHTLAYFEPDSDDLPKDLAQLLNGEHIHDRINQINELEKSDPIAVVKLAVEEALCCNDHDDEICAPLFQLQELLGDATHLADYIDHAKGEEIRLRNL